MTTPIDHRPEFSSPTAATHGWYGNLRQFVDTRAPLLLLGATLAGLLLRLIPLGSSSAGDEISTYYVLHGHSLSRVLQLVHSNQETSPPAYFAVAWLFNQVVRDTALAARLVSYLAGVAAIPLTYVLGRVTVQRRATSLLAASLVALAPFVIFLSTDGRAFMFVMTAALVSTIALLKAVHTGRIRWWSAYALSSGIAVYTHYTVAFLLLLQALWALVAYRRRWKGVIVANMVVAVAYVPWLPGLAQDLKAPNGLNALVPFSAGNVGNVTLDWWVGHPVIPVDRLPGYLALALVSIAVVAGATGALLGSGGGGAPAGRWPRLPELLLIVLLAAGPLLLVALYSATGTTILDARNVISSWPALALVMATLVATPRAVWVREVALVLLISGYSIGAVKSIKGNNQRPDLDCRRRLHRPSRTRECADRRRAALRQSTVRAGCRPLSGGCPHVLVKDFW